MLINATKILQEARQNKIAIPQLNINNLEWTKYILEECNELKNPVILGVSEGAAKYMGGYVTVKKMVEGLIEDLKIEIPVVIHLDHGTKFEECKKAIDAGFTSVMIDASQYDLQTNIKITKQVIEYAKKHNVSVEGEVGKVGGQEDGINSTLAYAEVEECLTFIKETNVDFLAPALGSIHGFYKGKPNLDFERMKLINENTNTPLVLHGGTGIPDEMIKKAIKCGISKINVNTELQNEWTKAVRKYLIENNHIYDPRKIISSGEKALKASVREKVKLFNE